MDVRVHIYTAMALGRDRVASPMLGRLYPRGKPPVLILQKAEWTSGPFWTRRSEEKSPPLRHPGSNPGRPAHSPVPCRLSYLALEYIKDHVKNEIHYTNFFSIEVDDRTHINQTSQCHIIKPIIHTMFSSILQN